MQLLDIAGPLEVFAFANEHAAARGLPSPYAARVVGPDLGHTVALAVAPQLVVFLKRPGGQAQFRAALTLQASDDRFAALHEWMAGRLGDELPLSRLAAEAGMSERSFSRRYHASTGLTPMRAVERLRVEAARQLLSETRLPLKRIAARCGFGSEETMRRSFLRVQGVGPNECRARFNNAKEKRAELLQQSFWNDRSFAFGNVWKWRRAGLAWRTAILPSAVAPGVEGMRTRDPRRKFRIGNATIGQGRETVFGRTTNFDGVAVRRPVARIRQTEFPSPTV